MIASITIAVNIIRTQQGFLISDLDSNSKLDFNHIDTEKLAYIEQKFREITGLDYNFAIVQQVIFPFLQDSFIDMDKAPVNSSEVHSTPC